MRRNLRNRLILSTVAPAVLAFATGAQAQMVNLGTAATYGVLAGAEITNVPLSETVINGDLGLHPGTSVTGFTFSTIPGLGLVNGDVNIDNGPAAQAKIDLVTAYNDLAGRPATADLTGQDLGGLVLTAGVYSYASDAYLTGNLVLDAEGNPNAIFIIDIDAALIVAGSVELRNGAQGANVYFRVGSSATLGAGSAFVGQILADQSITLVTGATIECGAALAIVAAVTLDDNVITVCTVVRATATEVLGPDATPTEQAIADIIDAYAEGATLPAAFQSLLSFLSPDELADAFSQLAGETATGVSPTGMHATASFLNLTLGRHDNGRVVRVPLPAPGGPPSNTVMTMGYANEALPAGAAFASFGESPAPAPRGSIWAGAYGAMTFTAGDPDTGTHDRTSRDYGMAIGVDVNVTPDAVVGFAVGYGAAGFTLDDGFGGGTSRVFQIAGHTQIDFEHAYLTAGVAYALHSVRTERTLDLVGTDVLVAEFTAHGVGGQIEGGYTAFDRNGFSLTPYAMVRAQGFFTPAYGENAVSGSDVFALDYAANSSFAVHTELGTRAEHVTNFDGGGALILRSSVAWGYDYASPNTMTATFQSLPGSDSFVVPGAMAAAHSVLVTAGAEVQFNGGFSIATQFDGAFGRGSRSYGVSGELRYTF